MDAKMREQLLKIIETNALLGTEDLAVMLGTDEADVQDTIHELEERHIICGYRNLINWGREKEDDITALIELRVTPQGGEGYEKIAAQISAYPQVESLYLLSGSYDFLVTVRGKTLKEVAMFVSEKLASMHEVQSTTTHFTLTKYKELGVMLDGSKRDERMVITP